MKIFDYIVAYSYIYPILYSNIEIQFKCHLAVSKSTRSILSMPEEPSTLCRYLRIVKRQNINHVYSRCFANYFDKVVVCILSF